MNFDFRKSCLEVDFGLMTKLLGVKMEIIGLKSIIRYFMS